MGSTIKAQPRLGSAFSASSSPKKMAPGANGGSFSFRKRSTAKSYSVTRSAAEVFSWVWDATSLADRIISPACRTMAIIWSSMGRTLLL